MADIPTKIEHLEDRNRLSTAVSYGNLARKNGVVIPLNVQRDDPNGGGIISARIPPDTVKGEIHARIDDGIWLVDCTNLGCNSAGRVSELEPFFICVDCGSPEWDNKWRGVIFPTNKAVIELELMRRPQYMNIKRGDNSFTLVNRNWLPGESVADLKHQRLEMAGSIEAAKA